MYEEDAISLGDDEPFAHKPFTVDEFDEIDTMVLDRYNATLIMMGTEASLFRQVPSVEAIPIYVEELLLQLTCWVECTTRDGSGSWSRAVLLYKR